MSLGKGVVKKRETMKLHTLMKTLFIFFFLLLSSCSNEVADETAMPVASDDNCRQSNIMKIKNKAVQRKLASLCIRRGPLANSKPRAW